MVVCVVVWCVCVVVCVVVVCVVVVCVVVVCVVVVCVVVVCVVVVCVVVVCVVVVVVCVVVCVWWCVWWWCVWLCVCGTNDSRHGESVLARAYYAPNWVAEHLGASSRRPRHPFPALMAGEPWLCTCVHGPKKQDSR